MVQITHSPTGGHGIISSHLPKWAKPSQAEAQGQDRLPVQGMLICTSNSQTMQPESLQPSPCPCMVAVAALQYSAAALTTPAMPLADVTNRLNSNQSCWKVPVRQEIQLFSASSSQDTVKPVHGHCRTSHRYTPLHGKCLIPSAFTCISDVYVLACPDWTMY